MVLKPTPWVARFEALLSASFVRKACLTMPEVLQLDASVSASAAEINAGRTLAALYYPSQQDLGILRRLIEHALAYCEQAYESETLYRNRIHASIHLRNNSFSNPICLTGLAGVGKSQLLKAFCRLFSVTRFQEAEGLIEATMEGPISVTLQKNLRLKSYLNDYINRDTPKARQVQLQDAIYRFPHIAYTNGAPYILIDETQFQVGGNSMITIKNTLLQFMEFGIPLLFVANFSLIKLLNRSPEQVRQRLLTRPIELKRDGAVSDDWKGYLRCCDVSLGDTIAPGTLSEHDLIHHYTGGIKRFAVDLLKISYRKAYGRKKPCPVTLDHIREAFLSADYAVARYQIEAINAYVVSQDERSEYHNPLKQSWTLEDGGISEAQQAARDEVARRASSAMMPATRDNPSPTRAKALPKAAPRPRRSKIDTEDLKSNALRFGKGLYGRSRT